MSVNSWDSSRNPRKVRVVFLGDQGVGKSSLIDRYSRGKFEEAYSVGRSMQATVGIDFNLKDVVFRNKPFRLQMWDTAGQERYRSLIPVYLKNADCVVFVCDLSKASSFEHLRDWHQIFVEHQSAPGVIVANKSDLSCRKVASDALSSLSKELGMPWVETSVRLNRGVEEVFEAVLEQTHDRLKESQVFAPDKGAKNPSQLASEAKPEKKNAD